MCVCVCVCICILMGLFQEKTPTPVKLKEKHEHLGNYFLPAGGSAERPAEPSIHPPFLLQPEGHLAEARSNWPCPVSSLMPKGSQEKGACAIQYDSRGKYILPSCSFPSLRNHLITRLFCGGANLFR